MVWSYPVLVCRYPRRVTFHWTLRAQESVESDALEHVFPYSGNNNPNSQQTIFSRGVETTNQLYVRRCRKFMYNNCTHTHLKLYIFIYYIHQFTQYIVSYHINDTTYFRIA